MKQAPFILLLTAILLSACSLEESSEDFKLSKKTYITSLASPINLKPDTTRILIKGYFPEKPKFTKIKTHKALKTEYSENGEELILSVNNDELPQLSLIHFYIGNDVQSILLKKSEILRHQLFFDTKGKEYKSVKMKGEMNAWNPDALNFVKKGDKWTAELQIAPGNYQYCYIIDGKEMTDPANPDSVSNGMGGYNSVLRIAKNTSLLPPVLQTSGFEDKKISIEAKGNIDTIFFFIDNQIIPKKFISEKSGQYTISLPSNISRKEKSYIRVYACNEGGISNDLLIPLKKGKLVVSASDLERTDFRTAILYNTFIDRFNNADSSNDRPTADPAVLPKANFFGGDIKGVTAKIKDKYFDSLGINTIWISPVIKNPEGAYGEYPKPKTKFSAYHGYWPVSFTLIDDRFGTAQDLKELVNTAHEHNMNVLLDFVANHVHKSHPYYKAHPETATELHLPDGSLNTERWDTHRLTTWFDVFLPTLDLAKPEVYEMLSDSALFWIKEYNLDGFRHDATKHIPEIFWKTLTHKLRTQVVIPENRNLYQIGETYGSPQLIGSYVNTPQLDAQFDFNMYDSWVGVLAGNNNFKNAKTTLQKSLKHYGHHHLMGNITGNQDRGRFISYASGSLKFSEDAKYAGWNRDIGVDNPVAYKKAALLNALLAVLPGVPVIYYGDEIGLPGGNDPDNRRMMRFNNLKTEEKQLRKITARLLKFRRQSMPLIYGETIVLQAAGNIFILKRNYFGKQVYLAVNNCNKVQKINIETDIEDAIDFNQFNGNTIMIQANKIEFEVPAYSFELIYN